KQPELAQSLDLQMLDAVNACQSALEEGGNEALAQLAQAMNKAADCFFQWGLVSESLQQHMQQLLKSGALAVKPTGSGGGGYVVSLWEGPLPEMDFAVIKI
ncbi:MAG: mevalonate kinase, partial [Legionella sp.]